MPKWIDKLKQRFGENGNSDAQGHQHAQYDKTESPQAPHYRQETHHGPVVPQVYGEPQVLGIVSDPRFNRDSGTSVRVGHRELWTWRDTGHWPDQPFFFTSSTAAWSDFDAEGRPKVEHGTLRLYHGDPYNQSPYFAIPSNECNPHSGAFEDGSRIAIWPDTRPLAVPSNSGNTLLYTWIKQPHIIGLEDLIPAPATALYRAVYHHGSSSGTQNPPDTKLLNNCFWPTGSIAYGSYGYLVHDEEAYLYGKLSGGKGIAVAKVAIDKLEDPKAFRFYTTSSGWSTKRPEMDDSNAAVPNAGTGGQGTYYYSRYFKSFVWIGGSWMGLGGDFYVATAPAPEGPWTKPAALYTGEVGTGKLPAYSHQAHPGLSEDEGNGRDIYITYTKVDASPGGYSTPLIRVVWQ